MGLTQQVGAFAEDGMALMNLGDFFNIINEGITIFR